MDRLVKTKETKSKALNTLVSEILTISNSAGNSVDYKFSVRGFWDIPKAVVSKGTNPQEVIQFVVEYRYLSKDGKETPIETFSISDSLLPSPKTAAFSNWVSIKIQLYR